MGIPSSLYLGLFWPLFIGKILRGGPCLVVFWIKLLTMSNLSHSSSFTHCCYFYFYYYDFVAFCLCYENTSSPSALMLFIVLLPFRSSVLSLSITSLVLDPWLVIIVYHSYHFQCGTHPPYHPLESSAPSPSHQHFAGRLWQPRGRFTLRQGLGPRSQEARNMDKQRRLRCRKLAILAMWSLRPKRDETWKWRHSIQMSPFFFPG